MAIELKRDDIESLKAARGSQSNRGNPHVRVKSELTDEFKAMLQQIGLSDDELAYVAEWMVIGSTPAGVTDTCRYPLWMLQRVPALPELTKKAFWDDQMGGHLACHSELLADCRHALDREIGECVLQEIGIKVAKFFVKFATDNSLSPGELFEYEIEKYGKTKPDTTVALSDLWYAWLSLSDFIYEDRECGDNPEDLYDKLSKEQKARCSIDVWGRDDKHMLMLILSYSLVNRCIYCGVVGSGMGWSYGGIACCPRCHGGDLEIPEQDEGPTIPEHGTADYVWALNHGLMWDEFNQKYRDSKGFDPAKKTLCPQYKRCPTRCAEDQQNGVRGWPLGSSDECNEVDCQAWRRLVAKDNGLTDEQFDEMIQAEFEASMKKSETERKVRARAVREGRKVAAAEPGAKQLGLL